MDEALVCIESKSKKDLEASLVAQRVKRLPAIQETWVRSLGQEDPLEKEMATYSSILFFFLLLNFYFYFILVYNTVLVLPYIDMNPPRVYMRSQT